MSAGSTLPARRSSSTARRRRAAQHRLRRLSRLLAWLLSAVLGSAGLAYAQVPANTLPSGGRVVVGNAQLQQSGNLLLINQSTPRLGLDWQSFSIGRDATVEFRQPGRDSVALNRVVGHSGSEIYGQLRANGQVFLVNPNGVLFAPGAKVDVGGLLASALDITQADFAAGRLQFNATGSGAAVTNQGELRASAGGYLALFGQQVDNQGTIQVDAGQVVLASGRAATVSISGNGLLSAVITPGATGSVNNSGLLQADGGVVTMTARAAEGMAASLVNNSGVVRANTIEERNGEIWITGDNVSSSGSVTATAGAGGRAGKIVLLGDLQSGTTTVSGRLDASAGEGGRGGFIETSAAKVRIAPAAEITTAASGGSTGTWLIDPTDYNIGGPNSDESGAALSTRLASNNISILSTAGAGGVDGNINVFDAISWSSGNTLTLTADLNVNVNANITASGVGAGLVLTPGSGGSFNLGTGARISFTGSQNTLQIAGQNYTLLRTLSDLVAINTSNTTRAGNYALADTLDASASAALNNGLGFTPIGNNITFSSNNSFRGRFDGLGNSITGLTVNNPSLTYVGLFGVAHNATIRNLTLSGGSFTGRQYVGALMGYGAFGSGTLPEMAIANVHSNAPVTQSVNTGSGYAGGLVGLFAGTDGTITGSSSSGSVSTADSNGNFGGLVGAFAGRSLTGSSASGNVSTSATNNGRSMGGLVGSFDGAGTLGAAGAGNGVSASGNVSGGFNAGGLVGFYGSSGAATQLSASGSVTGTNFVGGLIGDWNAGGAISNAQASGTASGSEYVGGLIGRNLNSGSLTAGSGVLTASGNVSSNTTGTTYTGGLVGSFTSNVAGAEIRGATASGTVTSSSPNGNIGGLVGNLNGGNVASSSASGDVTATSTTNSRSVGGLIGADDGTGTITNVSATGAVSGGANAGGLIGYHGSTGLLSVASAQGSVSGIGNVGGLVGNWDNAGTISNAQTLGAASVTVSGTDIAGGLIGRAYNVGSLTDASAARAVTGASHVGGLVGYFYGGNITTATAGGSITSLTTGSNNIYMGGLVGYYQPNIANNVITGTSATASINTAVDAGYFGGLFGRLTGGTLSNSSASGSVTLTSTVNNSRFAGGLVGAFDGSGGMSSVGATGAISGGNYIGGLVGYYGSTGALNLGTASGNVSSMTVGNPYAGGLVGYMASAGAVTNSEATGNVSTRWDGGGLIGYWVSSGGITDSRATGDVTGTQNAASVGGLVGYGSSNGPIVNSSADGDVSGGSRAGGLVGYLLYTNVSRGVAHGNVSIVNDSSARVGGLIGDFYNYNTVATIADSSATGLSGAPTVVYGDAPNVYAGGLVGIVSSSTAVITNSSATARVTATDTGNPTNFNHYAGGLIGSFSGTSISDVSATGNVSARYMAGGLVGEYSAAGSISNATATGNTTARDFVGGLVGYMSGGGGVNSGSASGDVASTSTASNTAYVGGLLGYASITVAGGVGNSRATGDVTGGIYTGGLIGYLSDSYNSAVSALPSVSNSSASGSVTGIGYAGGLVGYSQVNGSLAAASRGIRTSVASGDVQGVWGTGGLVGYYAGYSGIQDSMATGNVSAGGSYTSTRYLGGLVGYISASSTGNQLLRSHASGNVTLASGATLGTGAAIYGGGLVGAMDGPSATAVTLADSWASGSVNLVNSAGSMRVGGLVGYAGSSISTSYSTGSVSATGIASGRAIGGLVGQRNTASVVATNSYWATDSSGNSTSVIGTGATLAQLSTASFFPTGTGGWDIATTGGSTAAWRMYDGQTTPLVRSLLTPLTLSLANVTKVYDGTTSLGSAAISIGGTGVSHPERIFVGGSSASANAGSYALAASNVYSNQRGYDLTLGGTATLTIDRRPLSIDGLIADKVYDGTTAATLAANPQFVGLVAGEDLVFQPGTGFAAAFDTKTAGVGKSVTLVGSYSLGDGTRGLAANYLLPTAGTTVADIEQAPLTAGSFTATNRAYDGSTVVAVNATSATLQGVIGGDAVSVNLAGVSSGSIADKNVGTGKAVTINGIALTGADAGNYRVVGADTLTVDITPRLLTLNGITASSRQYNANTSVSLGTAAALLTGVVSGDDVLPRLNSLSGTVADKNVAYDVNGVVIPKAVTVTGLGLRGQDAANYAVQQGSVSATITPYTFAVRIARTTGTDRVYDGTADATTFFPCDWYCGDDLVFSATSITFADRNVAYNGSNQPTSKIITANGITYSGTDAGNYTVTNTTATTTGTISPKPLAVSGVNAVGRAYDGTRDVTVNIASATVDTTAVLPIDQGQVSVATPGSGAVVGQMADKNVGTNKAVTVPGLTLTGSAAGNYTINSGSGGGVVVTITRKDLTAVYTGVDRVYDGTAYAALLVTSADIVTGDSVNFYADQSYCTQCGYGYFTVSGYGTNNSFTQSRHVGTAIPVIAQSNGLYGTDSGNYQLLNPRGQTTANITPRPVNLAFSGVTRVYDGSTDASVTLSFNNSTGPYSVDASGLTVTSTAVYTDSKNVGNSKPIAVSNIQLSGTFAGNYTVNNTTATASGNVTAKPITVGGIAATDRPYDGTTLVNVAATGALTSSGFVQGDIVSVNPPSGGFTTGTIANRNVGSNKPVTVTGLTLSGADAGNYLIDPAGSGITVNITQAALTPTFTGGTRVYDGSTVASVTSTTAGIVSGDVVTVNGLAAFTGTGAKDVGTNKPISVTGITLSGSGAANYSLASTTASTTGGITPKPVNITFAGGSRVYNGLLDLTAPVVGSSLQFVAGDQVGTSQVALFTGDGSAGINKAVSVSSIALTGAQAGNYSINSGSTSTTATVTPRPLGVTGITATNRVYDGTTTVAVSTAGATVDFSNVIGSDQVSAVGLGGISFGAMADRNAGTNKPVTVTGISLTGAQAANYVAVGATGLTVSIAPLAITPLFLAADKVYNGNATATISANSSSFLPVDAGSVGISATGLFTTGKNVGSNLAVSVSGAFLTGASRDNYSLLSTSGSATASITPRTVNLAFAGQSKVYDGTDSASVTASFGGIVGGDLLSTTQTAVFSTGKGVGNNKPIVVSNVNLGGTDAGNYTLGTVGTSALGNITPKPITVSGLSSVTAQDRVYDGTRTVAVTVPTGVTLTPSSADIVAGDDVQINVPGSGIVTGTMADKNAGSNKPLAVDGLSLSGADGGNYAIVGTNGVRVNIARLPITATFVGTNRVYNGNTAAAVTGTAAGLIAGDLVTINGSGFFSDSKNVGTGKPITITSALLSGADSTNYTLTNTSGAATAAVTPLMIAPAFTGGSRVYDGTDVAPVTASSSGFITGDGVSLTGTAVFTGSAATAKNVGSGKAVLVSGITLTGSDAANYGLLSTTANTTASITPRPLTLTGLTGVSASDRTYDGTTTVQVTVQGSGTVSLDRSNIIGNDDVNVSQLVGNLTTGTVATKDVGNNKAVVVSGLQLTGTDAANYAVAATQGVTVNITPKNLTATFTGQDKVYDGTAAATLLGSSGDIIGGDVVAIGGSGLFVAGKNVGNGLQISVTGGTLSGTDAGNYTLLNPSGTATANITPRAVNALYTGGNRIYDGTLLAPVTGTVNGLIAGDSASLLQTAVFADKNAGSNKTITITGITLAGADAANYSLGGSGSTTTTGTITPKPLGVIGLTNVTADDRVYDGTRNVVVRVGATGTVSVDPADLVAGDDVTLSAPNQGVTTGLLLDRHAGTNKPVAVAGLTLGGIDAGNYSVAATSGVTVNIAPKPLTATWVGQDKVYDGTAAATLTGSSLDIVGGDLVTISGNGLFAAGKNVGAGLAVNVSGGTLAGADAANYLLGNTTGSVTASITPRTLGITYTGGSRVYDGTTAATVTSTFNGLVSGDVVTAAGTAAFASKNVGNGLTITVSGIGLAGTDAGNYQLVSTTASTTGSITPRDFNVTGLSGITAVDRPYDGGTGVQVNITGNPGTASGNALPGDDVNIVISGTGLGQGLMLDKHVGSNKPVALSGLSLGGADAGNYRITGTAGVTVNITPIDVSVAGLRAIDRVYDGSTTVGIDTAAGVLSGVLSGDDLQLLTSGVTATAASRNAGTHAVNLTGLAMGGSDAGNYRVVSGQGLTVSISPRALTVGLTSATKMYDGSTGAGSATLFSDALAGDDLVLGASNVAFATRNVGGSVAVVATGLSISGTDAANYTLATTTVTGTGSITPRPLTVAGNVSVLGSDSTAAQRSAAIGFSAYGLVGGDTVLRVTQNEPAQLGTAPGGTYLPLPVSDAVFGSGSAANYDITYVPGGLTIMVPISVSSGKQLAIELSPEEVALTRDMLSRTSQTTRLANASDTIAALPGAPLPASAADAVADEIAALLSGDSRRITLPVLRKLPLISLDPLLRRILDNVETTAP